MQWHTHGPRSLECVGKAKGNIENKLISERKQIYKGGNESGGMGGLGPP